MAAAERCAPGAVVYRSRRWAASGRNRDSTGWRLLGEAAGPGARSSGCSDWSWRPPPPGTWLLCTAASARSANATSGRTCRVRGGSQGGGVGSWELAWGRRGCRRGRRGYQRASGTVLRQGFVCALWRGTPGGRNLPTARIWAVPEAGAHSRLVQSREPPLGALPQGSC